LHISNQHEESPIILEFDDSLIEGIFKILYRR